MTDYQMEEIYGLVEEAFKGGQAKIELAAFPFRMTTQNLARYAYDPTRRSGECSNQETMRSCNGATAVSCCLRSALCVQSRRCRGSRPKRSLPTRHCNKRCERRHSPAKLAVELVAIEDEVRASSARIGRYRTYSRFDDEMGRES